MIKGTPPFFLQGFAAVCLAAAAGVLPAHAAEVVRVERFELHSSFWMSLHQTLMEDASRSKPRDLEALSPEQRKTWGDAVAAYREAAGHGDMTFVKPMAITNDAISQVADDALEPVLDAPLADTLKRAAPVYRAAWWTADDKANRFFIAYTAAMLRDAGEELVHAHEAVYRSAWPERVTVFIAPYGGPFGGYTMMGRSGGVITTMSSRIPATKGCARWR